MALTKAALLQPQGLTTTERNLLALAGADTGRLIYNETTKGLEQWDGAAWVPVLNAGSALSAANLTGQVLGNLLTGTVQGNLLTGTVQSNLLTGDIDGGVY
jgi:hypothetical protein